MRHTLKAVFDDRGKARKALETLVASGYARADTDLVSISGDRSDPGSEAQVPTWRERPGASSTRLLSRILGQPGSRPSLAGAGQQMSDSHVLTLSTDSAAQAERAASLVSGLMHSHSDGTGTGVAGGAAGMRYVTHRRTAVPGALQFHAREVTHYFGTRDAGNKTMPGTTFRERMPPAGQWPGLSLFDAALKDGRTVLSRDGAAMRAAFRFGHDMHEDERYRNRTWHESDADLKQLWEASDVGRPGWDGSAAAVRRGWDSVSPEIDDDSYHGHHVRGRTMFHGRSWDDAEAELRAEWERDYREGKPATWDEMKAALHAEWDRTRA